jgi:hypothetical protein
MSIAIGGLASRRGPRKEKGYGRVPTVSRAVPAELSVGVAGGAGVAGAVAGAVGRVVSVAGVVAAGVVSG